MRRGATATSRRGGAALLPLVDPDERHAVTEVPPYPAADFAADLERVTGGRNDRALTEVLVTESMPALRWLAGLGLRYRLMYERQAYQRPDGSYLFWGGLHVGSVDGGRGLMASHTRAASTAGIEVRYGA